MRKVKFTQDSFDEKLSAILEEFPMLDVRLWYPVYPHFLKSLPQFLGSAPFLVIPHERIVR